MNKDEQILISKCISELNLQIKFFEKNKNLFISLGETWSDRAFKMLNALKKDNNILKNFKRSNLFNSDIGEFIQTFRLESFTSNQQTFFFLHLIMDFCQHFHCYKNCCGENIIFLRTESLFPIYRFMWLKSKSLLFCHSRS